MRIMLAALCAALFVVSLPAALLLSDAENLLFKSQTYKDALQATGMYARIPALASDRIVAALGGSSNELEILTAKDWQTLIGIALPPEQLRQIAGQTLDQVFDYLDGNSTSVSIPLAAFKQNLGAHSAEALRQVLATKPACTSDRLISLALQIASGRSDPGAGLCNPPPEVMSAFLPLLGQTLQAGIARLPERLTIFKTADQPDLLPGIQQARQRMRLSLILPLAVLALLSLVAVRSFNGLLRWWGIPFALAGALGLLVGLSSAPLTNLFLAAELPHMPALVAQLIETAPEVVLALAHTVAQALINQSLPVLLVGLVFCLAAFVTRRRAVRPLGSG